MVAEDFVTVGFKDSVEEAVQNNNKYLDALLQRCSTHRVKLSAQKARLEVPFIGHIVAN